MLSQGPGGLVWRGIPGPACAPGAPVAAGSEPMMSAGFSGMQQQPAQQMPGDALFALAGAFPSCAGQQSATEGRHGSTALHMCFYSGKALLYCAQDQPITL